MPSPNPLTPHPKAESPVYETSAQELVSAYDDQHIETDETVEPLGALEPPSPLEERVEYPYQNIRTKNYQWGDGDKTIFWNDNVNYHNKDKA
ncbi:cytochrome C oxidase subunit [Colletotrichum tofieldiae]|nr:cytochrome C oxidase subunit [Colletotrichum tofieldiae]